MGNYFLLCFIYADDITLLAPSVYAMLSILEKRSLKYFGVLLLQKYDS